MEHEPPRLCHSLTMGLRPVALALTVMMVASQVHAFEFETGIDDLKVRWDNTVRINYAERVDSPLRQIQLSPIADEGTNGFGKGSAVTKRFDLLSELDVTYQKSSGFRVSGAAWYDLAYDGKQAPYSTATGIPTALATALRLPNRGQMVSYDNGTYSPFIKRYYAGPSGEILDAFAFTKFDVADMSVALKAGRHTQYWGESLFLGGMVHGIAYSQMPVDLQKGFATPGAEAKELFRPLNNISAQVQVNPELTLGAQYFLDWESMRYPEGGTYLGPVDFVFDGPDRQFATQALGPGITGVLNLTRAAAKTPDKRGDFGLSALWRPEWLAGTIGLYYRRYSDKIPQAFISQVGSPYASIAVGPARFVGINGQYQLFYPDKIDLYGLSFSKNILGVSVGAELSYRKNTPLLSQTLGNAAALVPTMSGTTPGPRGDTMHGVLNAVGLFPQSAVFDLASYAAELTWQRYNKVKEGANQALFQAEGYGPCKAGGAFDLTYASFKDSGCATKNFIGLALSVTPTWFGVIPSGDLSMPIAWSVGLKGNSSVAFGGNEGMGNYSIGLALDYLSRYRFELKYVDFFGKTNVNPATGGVGTQNGFFTLDKDRGFVAFTFKTAF